jgi:biotin carboxyl carrier protein
MLYHVSVGGRTFQVEIGSDGVRIDEESVHADLVAVPGTPVRSLRLDGASYRVVAHHPSRGSWSLHVRGRRVDAEVVDERTRAIREMTGATAASAGPRPVSAPMPGLVVKVEVAVGDLVRPGQGIVIVEAMKMENELKAQAEGVVRAVHVSAGDTVEKGRVLVDFEAPAEGSA